MTVASRLGHRWASRLLRPAADAQQVEASRRRREMDRLAALPRFTPTLTDLCGHTLEVIDSASFLWTYTEIFENRIYEFRSSSPAPRIIDGGANIGLSILFFKSLYPDARITSFEPDPAVHRVLERNVRRAGLADVAVERYGLWSSVATLPFASDGADGGRIVERAGAATVPVHTVRLRDYVDEPIDLLKLDIEGAETEVLLDCEDRLGVVQRVYVEYHSFAEKPQTLHVLLAALARAGFRVHIAPVSVSRQPFLMRPANSGFDLQLHVFGYRE